jgi:hypothetical protein
MENLFRSPRLIYRAIEDTPDDEAFIHSIQSDILAFANSDNGLLVPMTKAESKKYKNKLVEKALLAAIRLSVLPHHYPTPHHPHHLSPSVASLSRAWIQHRSDVEILSLASISMLRTSGRVMGARPLSGSSIGGSR